MHRLLSDIRHGARVLLRTPGVTVTALIALALAIGANTAMFSIVDAVLLRPLPYEDPDRLVMVWEDSSYIGFPRNTPAPANWQDWKAQNTVFTDIAASRGGAYALTGDGPAEYVPGRRVTASLWTVLGTKPLLGRTFTADEERTNAKVAVISYGLWQRRYGGDSSVVGRKVIMSDEAVTVIGVMPMRFTFPSRRTEIWTPAAFTPEDLARRGSHFLFCVARLRPGVSLEAARSEMRVIAARLAKQYPESNRQVGAVVVPLAEQMTGTTRMSLTVLFCASGFVLLIACANIANLLLARAAGRTREVAVRAALGAGRGVIIRQLLTESVLLAVLGASAGLLLARGAMLVLEKMIPADMAGIPLAIDWRMLAFTAAVTLTTGLLFGLFPALSLGRVDLAESLKEGSRTSSAARHKLRDALVVSQTGLALALLTGAALMIQTLYHLQNVDLGMRTDGLLTLSTDLPRTRYPDHPKREAFFQAVLDKVRNIPGVMSAGYTSDLPLTAMGNTNGYILEGQTRAETQGQDALNRVVTAGFFETMGSRIREGRFFTESDTASTQRVAIVNETFADRHWPGQSALGKRIDNSGSREQRNWQTVVGVVKEIRERGITLETKPAVYTPLRQAASNWNVPSDLAIRTAVDPLSIATAVRHVIAEVDKDQPIYQMRTMDDVIDSELAGQQQQMTLLTAFAFLAVLLAGTGIYGVISYLVSQRRREIGVRMALGASPSEIVALVLRRGVVLIGGGLLLGLALSALASRLIGTLLFGVKPYDPLTMLSAAAFLAFAGLAACAAPARWAARLDPARVLRDE